MSGREKRKMMKAIKLNVVQRKYLYIALIIVFSFFLGIGIGQFTRVIDRLFREQTSELLLQTIQNQKLLFETTFQNQSTNLQVIANQLTASNQTTDQSLALLTEIQPSSGFSMLGIATASGETYNHRGEKLPITLQDYFPEIMAEQSQATPIIESFSGEADVVLVALPLIADQEFMGVIFGINPIANLSLEVQSPSFSGQSFGYIIDNQGTVITSFNHTKVANGENLFEGMQNITLHNQSVAQLSSEQLHDQSSGFISYTRDQNYIAYYEPLGLNDWTIISVAPESEFTSLAQIVNVQGLSLTAQIFLVFAAFVLYIIAENKRNEQLIKQQLEWARMNELKYKIALEQSDTMIFEYIVASNSFEFAPTTLTMVGLDPDRSYSPETFQSLGCFSDKVAGEWEQLFAQIQAGEARVSLTLPIKFPYKTAEWYEIYFTTIFDENNQPQRAIGKFVNVHAQHQHMAELIANAQKDSLTGVYNKGTTQSLISGILEHQPDAMHALFIIDIDDFKSVNDQFGHQVGDRVICEVANFLTATCRETDIVGRIGGDEFIIFLKDIHKPSIITRKAEQICEAFKNYYLDEHNHKISGSVGVALAPTHSRDFESLYELADQAMYQVKKTGKDRWQIALAEPENAN